MVLCWGDDWGPPEGLIIFRPGPAKEGTTITATAAANRDYITSLCLFLPKREIINADPKKPISTEITVLERAITRVR